MGQTDALTALGWALLPFWFLLLAGTLWHLWLLFSGMESFLDNVGFGMGAVVAAFLGGPFVIWGAVLKHRTVEFQKEGHITERISKAVEQLGAEKTVIVPALAPDGMPGRDKNGNMATNERTVPNIEVRIGGLLSLERIAQDSTRYDKKRDHVRVMEILCAYVRENAPASEAKDFPLPEWEPLADDASEEERVEHVKKRDERFHGEDGPKARDWAQSLDDPRADIALALRIIGRRTKEQLQVEARWGDEALDSADWVFDTPCPKLPNAPDGEPHPAGAVDEYIDQLDDWKMTISGYRGYRPDLRKTNLQKADLSKLTLSGARLDGARMEGVDLAGARMEGADLSGARLPTSLSAASLRAAALKEVGLSGIGLSQEQIDEMFGDASVTLPEGRERPAHWPRWELPNHGKHNFRDEWLKWQAYPEGYVPPDPPCGGK
ncbi:pentapeptide repeat-containing protein [Mameliella sp.]|uniref:pentapeptide repeat-containing protein n=1 Tax=Mameliella sp. TaxID=1924940 RepID=UPI003B510D70